MWDRIEQYIRKGEESTLEKTKVLSLLPGRRTVFSITERFTRQEGYRCRLLRDYF